jgi:aminopeptidase YwaD
MSHNGLILPAALALAISGAGLGAGSKTNPALPPSAELAYRALATRVETTEAFEIVSFMDRFWRLAGNPGYNASLDHIRDYLLAAGFNGETTSHANLRVDEFPNDGHGWDYRVGTVAFDDEGDETPLLSHERDRVSLAINSFPTASDGVKAPLVDVGSGSEAEFDAKDIKGSVVLTDAPLGRAWQAAVKKRGAVGVISTEVASYIRNPASTPSGERQDVLQWGSIPYDADARSFGFKASWKAATRMRRRLTGGPVRVRVQIDASFYDGPNRTLVAEIPGRSRPEERIVIAAHVQEPGANDNGSGCGSLYALARGLQQAITAGALPRPERTLTFIWADEIRGTREWIRSHPEDARRVQYMFAVDMTGEDTSRTGGAFRIEKQADPSAVWPRPSDPHTEWGATKVAAESLKGSLLNDLHLAVCLRRSRDTGWTVRTNPYEGGSDHTVFAGANIPSLLDWHFTDRYYHTNQDRLDKVSAAEMKNVAIAVGTSAWLLASANARDAEGVATLIEAAGGARLALERSQGRGIVARAADRPAAETVERQVLAAWSKWYAEALDSVLQLSTSGPTDALRDKVAAAKQHLH